MKRFCVKTVACQAPRPHDMHTISEVRGVRRQQLRDQMFQSTPPRGGRHIFISPPYFFIPVSTGLVLRLVMPQAFKMGNKIAPAVWQVLNCAICYPVKSKSTNSTAILPSSSSITPPPAWTLSISTCAHNSLRSSSKSSSASKFTPTGNFSTSCSKAVPVVIFISKPCCFSLSLIIITFTL